MRACDGAEHGGTVAPDAKIASFAAGIVAAGKPFAVVDGTGKPIGEVTPQAVIDLLAGHRPVRSRRMTRRRASTSAARPRPAQLWLLIWACALAAVLVRLPAAATVCPGPSTIRPTRSCRSPTGSARCMRWIKVEPVLADPLDHRGARRAARFRARPARQELQDRPRRRGDRPAAAVLGRRRAPPPSSPATPPAAGRLGAAGRRLLPLHRAVRPMDQRHADAGADLDRRAVLRRHRAARSASGPGASHGPKGSSSRRPST